MAEKSDKWASWPRDGKGSDTKKNGNSEGPKRRGYQETRKQDRDRRENWRRKDVDSNEQKDGKSKFDSGTFQGKPHPRKFESEVGDKLGFGDNKDKRYVKSEKSDKNSEKRGTGDGPKYGKSELKNLAKVLHSASPSNPAKQKSFEKKDSEIKRKAQSAADLESEWQKEAEEKRKKEEEEEKKRKEIEEKQREEELKKKKLEEEEQRQKEMEMQQIKDVISEIEDRLKLRSSLREDNLAAMEQRPDLSECGKLDSNLKKNTAFVKKMKNLTESQKDSLAKDFRSLNLSKYIGEAAAAIAEAKLKMSDVPCALYIASLLHQRYADFAPVLLENWQKVLLTKKDDKVPNPSKLRVDLRFFADLVSCGVYTEKVGLPMLANQLTLLIHNDREDHINLPIILSFCKHCGDDYAGLVSAKHKQLAESYNLSIPRSQLMPEQRQKACRGLISNYYTSLVKHVVKDHKDLRNMEKQNRKAIITKGELSAERKEKQDATQLAFAKLLANATSLSDLLEEAMPDLPEEEIKADDPCNIDIYPAGGDKEFTYDGDSNLFEDEDTRQFYENVPDLKSVIPGILYKESAQEKIEDTTQEETAEGEELDVEKVEAEMEKQHDEEEDLLDDDAEPVTEEVEEEDIASSMKLILDGFITSLPNCVNRDMIDKAAIDFCMNLNTKANRKKLTKALFGVHRTRYDLLPFYSRFVASLHQVMPDVATDLASLLKGEFKWHVRKKDQINIESKLKTVRFIGELTKFKMFPLDEVFHCVKMLLFDFSHHNIEMACGLFDVCGRFLYRTPQSHHRAKVYLDVMLRKKNALHLDSRYANLIENAYYYSNPPDHKQEEQKQRPPMHQYIRRLIYRDLNKINIEKVLRVLRKLDWDDEEIKLYMAKCLTNVWNVRFNIIHCSANLLAGLAPYHEAMAIQVVDGILENIRLGMELNHPKFNQRRVCSVKYLGELYNYRMVESAVIFKTLYSFISFGVTMDEANPTPLDPPEHLLRLRLACVIIDTCGQYFDRGSSKKKLDYFLIYMQRYYWFKHDNPIWTEERPFPMDIEYMVHDSVEAVRPKWNFAQTFEEAMEAATKLDEEFRAKLADVLPKFSETEEGEDGLTTIQEGDEIDELSEGLSQLVADDEEDERRPGGRQCSQDSTTQDSDYGGVTADSQDASHTPGSYSQSQRTAKTGEEEKEGEGDDDYIDSAGEDMDEDVHLVGGGMKTIKCQEDDDFMASFDKMMSDTLQHRNNEAIKVPQVDIVVPMQMKSQKAKITGITDVVPGTLQPAMPPEPENYSPNNIHFTLIMRKNNKPQLSQIEVPVSEEFAARFREREEQLRVEKERMKRVVLDIHDRQEEEDYQELLASMSRPLLNTNMQRERKVKYQHQKGAPDADQIFGSKW